MTNHHVDWPAIKTEYITTNQSYRQLSRKYGVSAQRIGKVATKNGWPDMRLKFAEDCLQKAHKKAQTQEVNRLARLIAATTRAVDVAAGAFEDEQQFNRYIVSEAVGDGTSQTTEKVFDKIDTKALKELTSALKDLTGLMRDFYNLPTPAQAEAQRIAGERLELERRKADAAETADTTLEIVGIPEEYKR